MEPIQLSLGKKFVKGEALAVMPVGMAALVLGLALRRLSGRG